MSTQKTNRNQLGLAESIRVLEILRKKESVFASGHLRNDEVAKILSDLSGISITESNVKALKKAAGITWKVRRISPGPKRSRNNVLALRILLDAVRSLYLRLGETPPATLNELGKALTTAEERVKPAPEANGVSPASV